MIRRSLSCDAFFFLSFHFLFSRRRLISVNQDLDMKNLIKTGLAIQTSFKTCPLKQITEKSTKALFHTIYEIRKIIEP